MEMVTRYAGEAHISAEDWAELNRGIVGAESYAFAEGRAFEAELISNNLLKIYDGCGVMQGREVRIPAGQSEEVTIENGTQGEKRIDLVVERYIKNEDTKVERSKTTMIKGTPVIADPQVPAHIEGNIRDGDMMADWPLYEVELDGINVVEVRPVFKVLMNMSTLKGKVTELIGKYKVEYVTTQVQDIPVKGANYNVQKEWEVPAGYEVESISIYAGSGCIAGNGGFPTNSGVLTASVYNPTTVSRSPYITWTIKLRKTGL